MKSAIPSARSSFRIPALRWRRAFWPDWAREPLLHFVILGAALFAADHLLFSRQADPRTIVVDGEVDREARQVFAASRGREPNADELTALRNRWLENEVLYREGLALQVDRGDIAIRERVIFKALSVIDAQVQLPPVDDATLRQWFETRRAKYEEPERLTFQEAVLAGDGSESSVRTFAAALNAGTPGDAQAGLRVFKDRPLGSLLQSYGPEFTRALQESPTGSWQAMATKDGWRAVRLEKRTAGRPADFAAVRTDVLQDWKDATLAEQRSAAVHALAQKYTIRDGRS